MQTWILDEQFDISAKLLDRKRLNAQVYEAIHILASLLGVNEKLVTPKRSVANHPASQQWLGFERHLLAYIGSHITEQIEIRHGKPGINLQNYLFLCTRFTGGNNDHYPLNNKIFNLIDYHRARLYKKLPEYYGGVFESIPNIDEKYFEKSAFLTRQGEIFVLE